MALTLTVQRRSVIGNLRVLTVDVDFDSSYPTGGEGLTPDDLGLQTIELVLPAQGAHGYLYDFDYTNKKLKALYPVADHTHKFTTGSTAAADATSGALAEVAAGTESVVRLMGTAIDTDYEVVLSGTGTKVAGEEVVNGADLSGATDVRLLVFGY